jgi:D-glycero-D-manno-heptose 1,7-bisphosphate phosphatase
MLYLFDMDGTLIRDPLSEPFIDYDIVEVLPRRREKLARLLDEGHQIAIITNQRGVAFKHQTLRQAHDKIDFAMRELGISEEAQAYVCYDDFRASDPEYADLTLAARGKPAPTMLFEAMRDTETQSAETMMIGDHLEDEQAAAAAGVRFIHAEIFFAETSE